MPRAWRCYILFFFLLPRTDYTFKVRLNLEYFFHPGGNGKVYHSAVVSLTFIGAGPWRPEQMWSHHNPCNKPVLKKFSSVQQYHLRNKTLKEKIRVSGCSIVEPWNSDQDHRDSSSTGKMRIIINDYFYCTVLYSAVVKEYIKKPQHGCFLLCEEMLKSA